MKSNLQLLDLHRHLVAYSLLIGLCATATYYLLCHRPRHPGKERRLGGYTEQSQPSSAIDIATKPGEWRPQKVSYPKVAPLETPVSDIKPIPYRPFRPGAYNVTMAIRYMPWDEWIELDNQFERYIQIRKHRIQTRGERAIRVLKDEHNSQVRGGGLAAIELVHELAAYLSSRYPKDFQITRHERGEVAEVLSTPLPSLANSTSKFCDWGQAGACPIKTITVVSSNVTYELPLHVADGEKAPERALEIAALLVQDDLALMIEGNDGKYYFQAGAIVVPGFWRLQDKIGLPLDEIHTHGDVPRYREKLQGSMERFFRRLQVDKPVARNNYFFQVIRSEGQEHPTSQERMDPEELGWSTTGNGPEDEFTHAHAFDIPTRPTPTIEQLRLRTERQTLRRLGVSGAIVFTIRTYLVPISELGEEKGVAERLASALRGWPEDIKEYKGAYRGRWWDVMLEFLDDKARMQQSLKDGS